MKVNFPAKALEIIQIFERSGFEIYLVGGAVRDLMMGKSVYDWDFTTDATPDQMLAMQKNAYYTNNYGTVGIPGVVEGERPYEVTTFRTEHGYSDSRRPDQVKWGKTLEEDLRRRDFTINAMALKAIGSGNISINKNKVDEDFYEIETELVDYYDGQKDLDKKIIRTVGNAIERFSEDALRMMRAVRIASELGFNIEEDTFQSILSNSALINKISKERVRDELLKILKSPYPYEGILILKNSGLMDEILPELSKTFGVEQKSPGRHHIYDVGTHSLFSLKFVSIRNNDPIVRLATLIHDIGKPQTYKRLEDGTITFYNHEIVSAKIARRIAERLRFSNLQAEKLYSLVRYHQFTVDEKQTDSAIRRFIRKVGIENLNDMLDLRIGDRLGGGARETSWRLEEFKNRLIEVQKQPFTVRDLKVSGKDVMKILKIESGPKVGEILKKLYDNVVEKNLINQKENLLNMIKEYKKENDK